MNSKAVTFANFLKQPYPYYFNKVNLEKLVIRIFLLGFFLVYFFEPFNVELTEHKMNYFWISFLHVAVSCLVFFGCFSLLNLLKIEEEKWTVGKEILSLAFVLLTTGTANFLIRDLIYNNPNNWSMLYLVEEIRNTFLIGILIVAILVPLNFARIYSRNSLKAETFKNAFLDGDSFADEGQVMIRTQLKADDFNFEPNQFLFAKAEGNYVEFHFLEEGESTKYLKRLTIKDLESQLSPFPQIVRTHRSYLVNLKKVSAVSGNAQGYQLSLQQTTATVPVSRGMIKSFDEAFARPAL